MGEAPTGRRDKARWRSPGIVASLTALQERYSQQYLLDFDPEAAIVRAGYKVQPGTKEFKRLLQQLTTNDNVQRRIAELRSLNSSLKPKERLACRYFLHEGLTQTEAYRKAGYRGDRTNASRFFSSPKIQRYLRQLNQAIAQQEVIDAAWVVRRAVKWVETGFVPITDAIAFLEVRDNKVQFKDDPKVTEEMRLSLQEATYTEIITENGDFRKEIKVKQHRRDHASLKILARYTGMENDFDAIVRAADKYGYTVVETPKGYEFIRTWDEPGDSPVELPGDDLDDDLEDAED